MEYYDYSKLRGRIREKLETQYNFANALGLSNATVSNKLNGLGEFSQEEIMKALSVLDLDLDDIKDYFFDKKVK